MAQFLKDIKLIDYFENPHLVTILLWNLNSTNFEETSSKLFQMISSSQASPQNVLNLISKFSNFQEKRIVEYTRLYEMILKEFNLNLEPNSYILTSLLYYRGVIFDEYFRSCFSEERIIDIYPKDSPYYYIVWDKIDELKSKFKDLDPNFKYNKFFTPLEVACQFGSEECFTYLRSIGAKYTQKTSKYACGGRSTNIFYQMIRDNQKFDNLIGEALTYRNFEVADYLFTRFGQKPTSVTEFILNANYDVVSYIFVNGGDANEVYILNIIMKLRVSFIRLWNSQSSHIFHCFTKLSLISHLLLYYDVCFHFIYFIVLSHYFYFHIHYYIIISFIFL